MAIFPFLNGAPWLPVRTERSEQHLLAMRILTEAVSGTGHSVHAWSGDDRLCFKLIVDGGPVVEFRGFSARGNAAYSIWYSDVHLAFVDVEPRVHVDPAAFTRRPKIRDRKGRPTITEAEYVTAIAALYVEIYRDVLERADASQGHLRPSAAAVAALKATAFVASCKARGIDTTDWARAAEASRDWFNPVEAREVRRIVAEEMLAAIEGRPLMTADTGEARKGLPE